MSEDTIKIRKEYVLKTQNPFEDGRGRIDNYELISPVTMANTVTSKARTVRANHYHPEQIQQVLFITGKMLSVHKDLINPNAKVETTLVKAGDLLVTPPMVAHAMIFLEDSTFINLVPGNRDHDKFGEHTVPHKLVDPAKIDEFIDKTESALEK